MNLARGGRPAGLALGVAVMLAALATVVQHGDASFAVAPALVPVALAVLGGFERTRLARAPRPA